MKAKAVKPKGPRRKWPRARKERIHCAATITPSAPAYRHGKRKAETRVGHSATRIFLFQPESGNADRDETENTFYLTVRQESKCVLSPNEGNRRKENPKPTGSHYMKIHGICLRESNGRPGDRGGKCRVYIAELFITQLLR